MTIKMGGLNEINHFHDFIIMDHYALVFTSLRSGSQHALQGKG